MSAAHILRALILAAALLALHAGPAAADPLLFWSSSVGGGNDVIYGEPTLLERLAAALGGK